MAAMSRDRSRHQILGFEPWDHGSHQAARRSWSRHGGCEWAWVTLPRGHWRWRMRLGAPALVSIAEQAGVFDRGCHWDAIFASSLCSLSDLISLMPASYAQIPRVLYMHENQAAYPASVGRADHRDHQLAITNLTSMLAADVVLWNSAWNRDSFASGIASLLAHDREALGEELIDRVLERSQIIWPPVEPTQATDQRVLHNAKKARQRGLKLVIWPHRWEHDKGPELLVELERQHGAGHQIGWVICGEQFERQPEAFAQLAQLAGDRVIHSGFAPRDAYETWLHACDWVVSTAHHEFFGMAVVEALQAGCLPWLPGRLSYPELTPPEWAGLTPMQPPADSDAVRAAIKLHLAPAVAREATCRLEAAIEAAIEGSI